MTQSETAERQIFEGLTGKQRQVLDLFAEHRTEKEAAARLDISVSAIKQRVDPLRSRLGGITRNELVRRYRDFVDNEGGCLNQTGRKGQVAKSAFVFDRSELGPMDSLRFSDSMSFDFDRDDTCEPKVLPRSLDGEHGQLLRLALVVGMLLALLVILVVGLTAGRTTTEFLRSSQAGIDAN